MPGQGVGREVEGAEGVAAARHVLPDQVAGSKNLQVEFQIWFLRKKKQNNFCSIYEEM